MKKLTVLTMAPAALVVASSVVVAAPPAGFSYDDYTATAGTITASCPPGYTCTNLDATGNGILQQRVTDGTDSYIKTIILEEGTTASDLAAVEALAFRNESYVLVEDGSNNMSARGIVQGNVLGAGIDDFVAQAEVSTGSLATPGGANNFVQSNLLQNAGRFTTFEAHGGQGNNLNFVVNAVQPNNEGNITIRKSVATAAGDLALTDADAGIPTLAYAAGNRVGVVWLEQAASGVGSAYDRLLGFQRYTNETAGTSIEYINSGDLGTFVATSTGANQPVAGIGPWNWNATLFGAAPNPYNSNATETGIAQPAVTFP